MAGRISKKRGEEGITGVVCAGEECGGYNSEQYVKEGSAEGMTVGRKYRKGV